MSALAPVRTGDHQSGVVTLETGSVAGCPSPAAYREPARSGSYHLLMALQPQPDPIDEEVARVLADNPGLRQELQGWDRRFAAGEVQEAEFRTTSAVRRRLGMSTPPE